MEERRNNNLDGMVKRAMDDDRPSDHTRQFEAPKYEETQYRTRTRSGETGSVGKSGSQSAVGSQKSVCCPPSADFRLFNFSFHLLILFIFAT